MTDDVSCLTPERLSRAVSEGADNKVQEHLAHCHKCSGAWQEMATLVSLMREIQVQPPSRERVEGVRTNLLTAPRARSRRTAGPVAVVTLSMAAAVLLGVFTRRAFSPARVVVAHSDHRSTVRALGPARFVQEDVRREEGVRLSEGTIQVEVPSLQRGERFRVQVGDGEIEGSEAAFEVTAARDRLDRVRVLRGLVQVRPAYAPAAVLHAGEQWPVIESAVERTTESTVESTVQQAPQQPALALSPPGAPQLPAPTAKQPGPQRRRPARPPAAAAAPLAPTPATAPTPPAAPTPPETAREAVPPPAPKASPADRAFAASWQALTARDYAGAARGFRQTISLAGDQPIAEDARFWLGVALARAGERDEAARSLRSFIDLYPRSPRRGEASSILGWQLLSAGALDEAERRFQDALKAPLSEVRNSASKGLAAVAARRTSH